MIRDQRRLCAVNPEASPRRDQRESLFRELFDRYHGPITHYFARLGFLPEECRDLAQDTFLRAYRGLGGFRGEARTNTWLFAIAKNIGRNNIRMQLADKRRGQEVSLEGQEPPRDVAEPGLDDGEESEPPSLASGGSGPLDGLLSEERSKLLLGALDALPARMRQIVLLRYGQDLKYREIAELLQISIETVKSHLFQARQRLAPILRERLSDATSEDAPSSKS